jgi:hypothetical protein
MNNKGVLNFGIYDTSYSTSGRDSKNHVALDLISWRRRSIWAASSLCSFLSFAVASRRFCSSASFCTVHTK